MVKHSSAGGFPPAGFGTSFNKPPLQPPMTFKSPLAKPHQIGGAWANNLFKQSQLSRHHAHLSAALPKVLPKPSAFSRSAGHKHSAVPGLPKAERTKAMKGFDLAINAQARMIKHQGHVKQMLVGTSKVVNSRAFKSEFPKATKPFVTLNRNLAESRKNVVALQASSKVAYAYLNSSRKAFEKGKLPAARSASLPRFADQGKMHRKQATLLGRIARTLRNAFGVSSKPAIPRPKAGARTPPLDPGKRDKAPHKLPPPAKHPGRAVSKPPRSGRDLQQGGALPRKMTPELRQRLDTLKQEQRQRNEQTGRSAPAQRELRELRERLRAVGAITPPTNLSPVTRRADHLILEAEFAVQSPDEAQRVYDLTSDRTISSTASRFEHNTYRGRGFNDDPSRGLLTRIERQKGPDPDGEDNRGSQTNAFRHTLWQALITRELGTAVAMRVGDAHEGGTPLSRSRSFSTLDDADHQADIRNNHFGRLIGLRLGGKTEREVALGVLTFFRDYGLWVVRRDGARYIPERQQITEAQFRAAVRMIATTNNEGYTPAQRRAAD